MEFFVKAHSFKTSVVKKDTKSEEKMKKQLKQMLYGYKKSDNDLIRKSEETIDDLDSRSVSGFSDLNLTYSNSSDNETTRATLDSSDLDSLRNINEESADTTCTTPNITDSAHDISALESNSDSSDINTCSILSNISITNSSDPSKTPPDTSSLFDVDGTLASKIHEKLNSLKTISNKKVKRKISEPTTDTQSLVDSNSSAEVEKLQASKKIRSMSPNMDLESTVIHDKPVKSTYTLYTDFSKFPIAPSPTFVSITAKNIKTPKFDDIFGHYKNYTAKNINVDQTNTLTAFHEFDVGSDDVPLNDDDSLIPELGTELNVSDADLDLTDNDNSSQVDMEGVLTDESVQLDTTVNLDNSVKSIVAEIDKYQVYRATNCYILVLRHPTNLFIHGKVIVQRLAGTVQIHGYNLKDDPCAVYAPYNNFAQALRTVEVNNDYYGLFNKLTTRGLSVSDAEEIVTTLGSYDVVIALGKLTCAKMDFVDNFFNVTNLFTPTLDGVELNLKTASANLGCTLYASQPYKHLEESPNWQQAVKCGLGGKSRGIVCGGKGAGKSTFLRFYVNQILSQGPVLVIDLDPGQCEFTVAGSISATIVKKPLLGPNFTHLTKSDIMLNLGIINMMDSPKRYINAVNTLITRCESDQALNGLPWIVNTMGMTNAMGLKFMCYIIQRVQPSFVLQIELQAIKKNFGHRLTPKNVDELYSDYTNDRSLTRLSNRDPLNYLYIITPAESYRLNKSVGSVNFSLAPRDERYLNFLAYFGELVVLHGSSDLLGITPYSLRLRDVCVATNIKIHSNGIAKVLNGKVVALCQLSERCDKVAKVFTLSDKPLLCHGHGLIRGIDYKKEVIYMITPLAVQLLESVDTILYADWVPELRGQEKNLPDGSVVPYRTQSQYEQRHLMFTPRRRFNPLQLLRISRNS